jgi:hypothetical protein
MSNSGKLAQASAIRTLSVSELDAVAGGIYVDPKKPRGPIIISDPMPPHPQPPKPVM